MKKSKKVVKKTVKVAKAVKASKAVKSGKKTAKATRGGSRSNAGRKPSNRLPMMIRISKAVRSVIEKQSSKNNCSLSDAIEQLILGKGE
jgi:hypothetical protein